jgi:hypothetical protein
MPRYRADDDDYDDRPRRRSRPDYDDDDDDYFERPRRKSKGRKGPNPLLWLGIGGGVLFLFIAGAVGLVVLSRVRDAAVAKKERDQAAMTKPATPTQPLASAPAAKPNNPVTPVQPIVSTSGANKYADLGEKVLSVADAPNDAPLRPPADAPIYKLTDARIGNPGPGPSPKLTVHYELVSGNPRGGNPTVVIRTPSGNEITAFGGFRPSRQRKAGDYIIDLGFRGGPRANREPKDLEVYLVRPDRRWDNEGVHIRYKVSNSAVVGEMGRAPQYARDWKPEEAARINNPPPEAPPANLYKNVGEDTEFADARTGGVPFRYADPKHRPLIGLDYIAGESDDGMKGKEKSFPQLAPVYDVKQSQSTLFQRAVAKPGYAVGGVVVKSKRLVNAIELIFMKQKPDGTLDPSDSYTKWIGSPDVGEKETKLGGSGRKVIGLHMRTFGGIYAFALVLDQ